MKLICGNRNNHASNTPLNIRIVKYSGGLGRGLVLGLGLGLGLGRGRGREGYMHFYSDFRIFLIFNGVLDA